MDRMREWPRRFPPVGEVRGLGLMLGIELVRDPADFALDVLKECLKTVSRNLESSTSDAASTSIPAQSE